MTPYHLVVPTPDADDGELEIPWDVIRRATDPEHAAHWHDLAVKSYRRDGLRLQQLRRANKLTHDGLATRAGLTVADLERIEQSDPDLVSAHTTRLLDALGLPHDALFTRPARTRKRRTVA